MARFQKCFLLILIDLTIVMMGNYASADGPPYCCDDDAYLKKGACTNGKNLTIGCKHKYLVNGNDIDETPFRINDRNELDLDGTIVGIHEYCLGKFDAPENYSAVVCVKEATGTNVAKLIATTISIIFLTLTIIVYSILPKLRDLQGKCILNSLIGLDFAFFILTLLQFLYSATIDACLFLAFSMYYAFMIAFFWLNLLSFHMWRTTVFVEREIDQSKSFIYYCLYGYGTPTLFLIATLITHHVEGDHIKPGFGVSSCWFSGITETWIYFYGPIIFLLICNTIFFVWTSCKLNDEVKLNNQTKVKQMRYRFCLYLKLFFIMGLTWIFEILSYVWMNVHEVLDIIWLITDFINAIQGILIFMILVLFRRRVLRYLANKEICGLGFPKSWKTVQDEECIENDEEEMHFEMK